MELTQQINRLNLRLSELGEENEMLCERLGVGGAEGLNLGAWQREKEGEREKLKRENYSLQREVQREKERGREGGREGRREGGGGREGGREGRRGSQHCRVVLVKRWKGFLSFVAFFIPHQRKRPLKS